MSFMQLSMDLICKLTEMKTLHEATEGALKAANEKLQREELLRKDAERRASNAADDLSKQRAFANYHLDQSVAEKLNNMSLSKQLSAANTKAGELEAEKTHLVLKNQSLERTARGMAEEIEHLNDHCFGHLVDDFDSIQFEYNPPRAVTYVRVGPVSGDNWMLTMTPGRHDAYTIRSAAKHMAKKLADNFERAMRDAFKVK